MSRPSHDKRQAEVLDGLVRIMRAEGFAHLRVGDMARRLHCSRGTLYELASSRRGLETAALCRLRAADLELAVRRGRASERPMDRVVAFVRAVRESERGVGPQLGRDVAASPDAQAATNACAELEALALADLIAEARIECADSDVPDALEIARLVLCFARAEGCLSEASDAKVGCFIAGALSGQRGVDVPQARAGSHVASPDRVDCTRQEEVLAAVAEIVCREGFSRLRVGALADRLHCSRSTLYGLAASKQALVLRVLGETLAAARDDLTRGAARPSHSLARVVAFLAHRRHFEQGMCEGLWSDVASWPTSAALLADHDERLEAALRAHVSEGVANGAFQALDPALVSNAASEAIRQMRGPAFSRDDAPWSLRSLAGLVAGGLAPAAEVAG